MKPHSKISLSDVPDIVRSVCMEFVVIRSTHEMAQFQEGMDTLLVGSLIKLHHSLLKQLFTYSSHQVTAQDLIYLLVPAYSSRGSNAREEEEAIMLNWNDYLQDLEGDRSALTPSSVLAFVTGSPTIPPMGFDRPLTIHFINDKSKTLPTASTCSLVLRLPLALVEYEHFKEMIDFAMQNTVGFGQV